MSIVVSVLPDGLVLGPIFRVHPFRATSGLPTSHDVGAYDYRMSSVVGQGDQSEREPMQ
jgi:hypothetical protein